MRRRALVLVAVAALTLVGCTDASTNATNSGPHEANIDDIVIGTSDALAPTITLNTDAAFTQSQGTVVWDGDGAPLQDNQPLLLDLYGVSLADGSEVINTFDGLPRSFVLAREVLGDELYELLINANVGARVLVVAPSTSAHGSSPAPTASNAVAPNVAVVVDVLSDRAVGATQQQRADLPRVTLDPVTGEPTVTIASTLTEPTAVQSETLIQGEGPQIKQGAYVLVNYKAVHWSDGSEFASSWATDTAPFSTQIGAGQVIPAWDQSLLDQTVGSQVLIVAPPEFGYPEEGTLVFVVDILDVWKPES